MTNISAEQTQTPSSTADIAQILRGAFDAGGKVTTSRAAAVTDAVTFVDLQNMSAVVDYPARDMTVTVQAGPAAGRAFSKTGGREPTTSD